jgi:lactate/malate dehydrogenase, NAD binding domain
MAEPVAESHRIAIISASSVGSAIAYALLLHPVAGTVLLVDLDKKLRRAQVQDLNDAALYGSVRVKEATTLDFKVLKLAVRVLFELESFINNQSMAVLRDIVPKKPIWTKYVLIYQLPSHVSLPTARSVLSFSPAG